MVIRLSEPGTGEEGVIVKVLGHGGFRKHIVEMGFIKDKTVEVLLNAPLKDPIKYKVLGYKISLRRQEAEMIEVVSEEEAKKQAKKAVYCKGLPEDVSIKEEDMKRLALGKRRIINVALVENPNSSKTSLFNLASGAHEYVGDYNGVIVDAKEGYFDFEGYHFRIAGLPGTYSLSAYTPEEIYVRCHIVNETPDVIINVVNSSNLGRNLYLTTQLIDVSVRMVVALNIYDELESSDNALDYHLLSKLFGVPMVPIVSKKNHRLDTLFHVIINLYEGIDFFDKQGNVDPEVLRGLTEWHDSLENRRNYKEECLEGYVREYKRKGCVLRHIHINHSPDLERAIDAVKEEVPKNEPIRHKYSTYFLSVELLKNDPDIRSFVRTLPNTGGIFRTRDKMTKRAQETMNEDCESAITDTKCGFISGTLKEAFTDSRLEQAQVTKVLDVTVTHRIWGYPISFLFIYLMFEGTSVLGEYPMMGIEWLVGQVGDLICNNMLEGPLKNMLVDGIVGGVGGVIVFLPNILILYFCISLMESSGYMVRAAFVVDKIMHKTGLHGKLFIPLTMEFGCSVPAIMASRTTKNRRNRLITMLVNPLISCSTRLPIYLLLVGTFFPNSASLVLLSTYAIGIFLAVLLTCLFSEFLIGGDDTPLVAGLPPYRISATKSIFRHTWEKGAQYLKKAGGIIVIASIIIWFLGYYPNHETYKTIAGQQENSYIGQLGRTIEPVIKPIDFNRRLGIGLISGAGAEELVVSTLGVLYVDDPEADEANLTERIPTTPLVAFRCMLSVLTYFLCIAVLAIIKQESGSWKWALFTACYTTGLTQLVAFSVYQAGGMLVWIIGRNG